ncbi:hypothetical protein [Virgibacillus sp. Bac332]|uniref:hypothetical protein n=1 Tax=Virgibacillus sp. Bac332 TaxID=2419842 RepID=UPI000EF44976|nr:hypothetical protein [Virgibacillus sp. Bac332]
MEKTIKNHGFRNVKKVFSSKGKVGFVATNEMNNETDSILVTENMEVLIWNKSTRSYLPTSKAVEIS